MRDAGRCQGGKAVNVLGSQCFGLNGLIPATRGSGVMGLAEESGGSEGSGPGSLRREARFRKGVQPVGSSEGKWAGGPSGHPQITGTINLSIRIFSIHDGSQ